MVSHEFQFSQRIVREMNKSLHKKREVLLQKSAQDSKTCRRAALTLSDEIWINFSQLPFQTHLLAFSFNDPSQAVLFGLLKGGLLFLLLLLSFPRPGRPSRHSQLIEFYPSQNSIQEFCTSICLPEWMVAPIQTGFMYPVLNDV